MSEQARIDSLKFAREGGRLHGEFAIAELPRLEDIVFERKGVVTFTLAGSTNKQGKPVVDVTVESRVALVCQRCLGRMDYELRRASRLVLIEGNHALPEVGKEDPNTESIPAEDVSDVADIIEQEVLLGLPMAPLHAEGMCEAAHELSRDESLSPFAVLGKLKRS